MPSAIANKSKGSSNGIRAEFWRSVKPSTLKEFSDVYGPDFDIFGYSFVDTLREYDIEPPQMGSKE